MAFRRNNPGASRGRGMEAVPMPSSEPDTTNSTTSRKRPTISFNLRALCDDCPPLQPINERDLQDTARHTYSAYCGPTAIPTYSIAFGRPNTGNYVIVSYESPGPSSIENDDLIREAESAARRCGGPVIDALGRAVCGASEYGLECRLTVQSVKELPHPELAPPLNDNGYAQVK